MFNADKAISEWRRRMLAGGVKNHSVLDELESHLREDVARQVQSGLSAEQAFNAAVRRIGEAESLKTEFAKAGQAPNARLQRIGVACIVILVGLILFFSGETILQMEMNLGQRMTAFAAVVFTLVVACGWRYVRRIGQAESLKTKFAKAGQAPNARLKRIGVACIFFLVGLILFFSGETIFHMEMNLGERMTAFAAVVFTLVVACGWRYAVPFLPVRFIREKILAIRPACGFYLKATALLMPTALIWLLSAVVVMPKLKEICHAGGVALFNVGDAPAIFGAWARILEVMVFLTAHDLLIGGAVVLAFIVLEWRSSVWRRYRRAAVGAGIFAFNFAVLFSLMLMVISALIASSNLMSHAK